MRERNGTKSNKPAGRQCPASRWKRATALGEWRALAGRERFHVGEYRLRERAQTVSKREAILNIAASVAATHFNLGMHHETRNREQRLQGRHFEGRGAVPGAVAGWWGAVLGGSMTDKPKPVPESNRNVPKYNKWKPEPAYRYASGVYRKGERK